MQKRFELLARIGYAARGVVYLLLGGIAFLSLLWGSVEEGNRSEGALSSLLALPLGRIVLGLIALGLTGHILWRLAQGVLDADGIGHDAKAIIARFGAVLAALGNGVLAFAAARMALVTGNTGTGSTEYGPWAWLLQQPFGRWLAGIAGVVIIGVGLVQIWRGVVREYRGRMRFPAGKSAFLDLVCRFGLMVRGVIFAIVGGLLIYAAFSLSPGRVGGLAEALDYVHELPLGRWLYGLVALGLASFGGYSIIQAFYRRLNPPDADEVRQAVPS